MQLSRLFRNMADLSLYGSTIAAWGPANAGTAVSPAVIGSSQIGDRVCCCTLQTTRGC
jgi:hypothetical protein